MEDSFLLEAIERYLNGDMLPEEKEDFEQLRKNAPKVDQLVVEHKTLFQQIDVYAEYSNIKHSLVETHNYLLEKGDIHEDIEVSAKGRIVHLWNKYRRITGIAASIAGITALTISVLVAYFSPAVNINKSQLEQLNKKLDIVQKNQQVQGAKLREVVSKIPKGFAFTAGGTAFMIDKNGYLVTNAHVLKGAGAVVMNRRGEEFNAIIMNIDTQRDLAILKIDDPEFEPSNSLPYSIANSAVELGEELFTLGYPRDSIVYSLGYLSAESGFNGDTTSCQLSLSANPGNSGGPVFSKNGEVVGIISTRQTQAEGVIFAVKAQGISKMIDQLKDVDTSIQKIKLPANSILKGQTRVKQIKEVEDYVFLVKSYNVK